MKGRIKSVFSSISLRPLLFVLLLISQLSVSLLSAPLASAWSPINPNKPYSFDIEQAMDNETDDGTYANYSNWRDRNYSIFEYNNGGEAGAGSGTVIFNVWNDNNTEGLSEYQDLTVFSGNMLCRWHFNGVLIGCQGGTSGLIANNVYEVKVNQAWVDNKLIEDPDFDLPGYVDPVDPNAPVPRVKYSVDRKHITGEYMKNLDMSASTPGTQDDRNYKVIWFLTREEDDVVTPIATITTRAGELFEYDVDDLGLYVLSATVQWAGSPFEPPLIENDDQNPVFIVLRINNTLFEGDTVTDECSNSGFGVFCESPSPYEDCSQYGGSPPYGILGNGDFPDIIGGFGCVINNFGVFMGTLLRVMFVPNVSFFEKYFDNISTFLHDKLGFVYQSIAVVVGLLTGLISSASSPNPVIAPTGTLFGQSISWDMSKFQQMFPVAWNALIILVRSVTVLAIMFALLRKYQSVMDAR